MRKTELVPGEYYHIYNHGVEDRKVFQNDADFKRALVNLVVFNDTNLSPKSLSRFVFDSDKLLNNYNPDYRECLIDIIAFSLLPSHYHLFVREKEEKGISRFMHRFDKGYARYFNLKNERRGVLWEGPFKAKLIDNEAYFIHIISYIHLNILDSIYPEWRSGKIKNWKEAATKMKDYPWSSYGFFRTGKNLISFTDLIITKPDWFKEFYPKIEDFEKNLESWSSRNIQT